MKEEIEKAFAVLKRGGIILYPTDTVWGIGCDATNAAAVDKIYALKKRQEAKALICLVNDFRMLEQYVEEVPEVAYDILKYANKPTTVVYDQPVGVAENLIGEDNSLGIRVTSDEYCQKLIRRLRRPIVSTSANLSGGKTPTSFAEIDQEIFKGVDYIVNLRKSQKSTQPSAIIKLGNDGIVKVIRK